MLVTQLFREEVSAGVAVHMSYVIYEHSHVRSIILLPPKHGMVLVLVTL